MNGTTDTTNETETTRPIDVGRHALVLGGSLAGLIAARVLSDHFDRVTLIERDNFPATAEARRGTPQANHVHALMLRGRLILEQLFPGLQEEMMRAAGIGVARNRKLSPSPIRSNSI